MAMFSISRSKTRDEFSFRRDLWACIFGLPLQFFDLDDSVASVQIIFTFITDKEGLLYIVVTKIKKLFLPWVNDWWTELTIDYFAARCFFFFELVLVFLHFLEMLQKFVAQIIIHSWYSTSRLHATNHRTLPIFGCPASQDPSARKYSFLESNV